MVRWSEIIIPAERVPLYMMLQSLNERLMKQVEIKVRLDRFHSRDWPQKCIWAHNRSFPQKRETAHRNIDCVNLVDKSYLCFLKNCNKIVVNMWVIMHRYLYRNYYDSRDTKHLRGTSQTDTDHIDPWWLDSAPCKPVLPGIRYSVNIHMSSKWKEICY